MNKLEKICQTKYFDLPVKSDLEDSMDYFLKVREAVYNFTNHEIFIDQLPNDDGVYFNWDNKQYVIKNHRIRINNFCMNELTIEHNFEEDIYNWLENFLNEDYLVKNI